MGQGLLVLQADRTIEFCNPAFANLVGHEQKHLLGRSLMELVKLGSELETAVPQPDEAEHDAQKTVRELELIHADGSPINVLVTAVPRNDDIIKDGVICVVTDLSAQKDIEHALAEARDHAIEATRLKSEFLANMSHEIRTPLNAVIGMTSLMLDSPLTLEQQDYANTIRNSGEVLLALINDILDFSKIEAGKLELEKRPFSVRDCVEEALDVVVTKAAEKGLELAYIIDDDVPNDILGDVTRVRQILVNLLNNAIKFTTRGEVVLSASCCKVECANSASSDILLRFSVKDTGIGILPERLDRLFKSFSQVDASTTRKHGGTGLGLAISKQLVEMMGGQIGVESEYEKGSTFHFTIVTRAMASQRRVYRQKALSKLKGKRLLIVDDNKTNCKILRKQTKLWGMVPTAVLSGAEAMALLEKGESFDLAILDMQMPEMDGIMLANEIRKLHDNQSLPLVMLSSIGARDEFKEVDHFAAFLTKPAKQQSLFETLTAVLSDTAVPTTPQRRKSEIDHNMGKNHPLRILLAEDNLINQKVALRILERMGYRADIAGDGLEVLESLQRQPYDVVLMDVQMPYMDGVEATEQIHDIWPVEEQPDVIAMTANALTGDREKYLMAGMDNYISKPVRIQELMEALAAVTPLTAKQKR
jgi:PAS domain S-box-containing protein